MKQQIMSIAAIAAIMSTSAIAFDATQGDGQLMKETGAKTAVLGKYTNQNPATPATTNLTFGNPGSVGDALIYPSFFTNHGFATEFSVINVSSTEAIVAKVVLYSAKDSKELRDFNIYLSANDVFRATIKDGKITSTDGSTVVVGSDRLSETPDHGYNYKDTSTMASEAHPFETTVDEDIGYIAVYSMIQADADAGSATDIKSHAMYHKKHNQLWRDYRHLLDQCRSEGWRNGLENGIYTANSVNQPNLNIATATILTAQPSTPTTGLCNTITDTTQNSASTRREVQFKSPTSSLTGTVTITGNDSKGTRAMTLKATPINGFTEANQSILWTEGELASIADRCIEFTAQGGNQANYNAQCIDNDVAATQINSTLFEFGSLESALVVTQPWKRTLVQMHGDGLFMTGAQAWSGTKRQTTKNGIIAGSDGKDYNVVNYGGFTIGQTVYNDDEDKYTALSGGFTVSPASTGTVGTIPNEMVKFNPLPNGSQYPRGYAIINYANNLHGIVTEMAATEIDGSAEINWLYPLTF